MLNTFQSTGGAAIACGRLTEALKKHTSLQLSTYHLFERKHSSIFRNLPGYFRLFFEKLHFRFYEKSEKERFDFSTSLFGVNLINSEQFKRADLIHLHWVNQGFLSLLEIKRILESGKPVFWTFHDMWPITGGCHHAGNCDHYRFSCGNCKFLKEPSQNDLSAQIWEKKKFWNVQNLTVVSISTWMTQKIRSSSLFSDAEILELPNTLDFSEFGHVDAKFRFQGNHDSLPVILFAAAFVESESKGFEMFTKIASALSDKFHFAIAGKLKNYRKENFPARVSFLGSIDSREMFYSVLASASIYVSTSREETFCYTVLEALANHTFTVAYNTGEIAKMIQLSRNGFLVENYCLEDFIKGINSWNSGESFSDLDALKDAFGEESVAENLYSWYLKKQKGTMVKNSSKTS